MRESLISHLPGNKFLKINEDLLDVTGRDHCSAAILALFEYWTNGAVANLPEIPEEIWIDVPMQEIADRMFGLYSERKIRDSIGGLESVNFIEVRRPKGGEVNEYRLNYILINQILRTQITHFSPPTGNSSGRPSANLPVAPTDLSAELPTLPYIKESSLKKEVILSPPTPSSLEEKLVAGSEDQYTEPDDFREPLDKRQLEKDWDRFGGQRLSYEQKRSLLGIFVEAGVGNEIARLSIRQYLNDPYWVNKGAPFRAFKKNSARYIAEAQALASASEGAFRDQTTTAIQPNAPSAFTGEKNPKEFSISAGQKLNPVAEWNASVISGPKILDLSEKDERELTRIFKDQRLIERWPVVLQLAASLHARVHATQDASWLTFWWVVNNWSKVTNGACEWITKPRNSFGAAEPKKTVNQLVAEMLAKGDAI